MHQIRRKHAAVLFLLILAFSTGIAAAFLKEKFTKEDILFERFLTKLFQEEVTANTITLHYTLAKPSSYGIHNYPITFGTLPSGTKKEKSTKEAENTRTYSKQLQTFDYDLLSLENQLIYDTLALTFETEAAYSSFPLLSEPLSPTLGIQAQLPILLAEYTFRCEQDLKDYLTLLTKIPSYFEEIIRFEQTKAQNNLFMNNETANRIIEQCNTFTEHPSEHYLITVFQDKLKNCSFLSARKKEQYDAKNKEYISSLVIPAYQYLAKELTTLLDCGTNPYGLYYFPEGKNYYLTLLRMTTGIYDSIETVTNRLYRQLHDDYLKIQRLLTVYPDLPVKCQDEATSQTLKMNPQQMLMHIQSQFSYDFPVLEDVSYSLKYVHKDLAEYLSPAFYLTPPLDTLSPNAIYINPDTGQHGLSLYATLAHEGFPGHLYQTISFAKTNPHPIRHLLANSGFIEGWATYIESYAYQYAPVSYEIGQYMSLQRSFYLCLYALLDIYIHYYGWTFDDAAAYLNAIGIVNEDSQKEIYQVLLEDPANYLKYCLCSLYIKDLKERTKEQMGSSFDTKEFHNTLLTLGPLPFPILEKYISAYLSL